MTNKPPVITVDGLIERYDGFLIDAYGVLVDKQGALEGAIDLLERLDRLAIPWCVVTNSASRLPQTQSDELAQHGLRIDPRRFVTSGSLLADHFATHGLSGCRCVVLGPPDSRHYAELAGGEVVSLTPETDAEVLIVADQKDIRFPEELDLAVSLMIRRLDLGQPLHLLLCNPDLIYPIAPGRFGLTAGGVGAMLEAVLRERYAEGAPPFTRLGKPYGPIFDRARRRLGARRPIMIGDQLGTDILGAARNNMDSALVATGLAPQTDPESWPVQPTWLLPSLSSR